MSIASDRQLALSTVSLRRYSLVEALRRARGLGFETVDLVALRGLCEHVPVNGTEREMALSARQFLDSGMRAASVNADPGSYDGADDRDAVDRRVDLLLDFAHATGTPIVVLPAGEKPDGSGRIPQIAHMVEALNAVGARAWERGVRIAVEAPYFGRPVDRVDDAAALLDELDPDIQLAFDVSHIEAADESVADAWTRFASRVAIIHLRDAVSGDIRRVIGRGRVDFANLFAAVAQTGFTGDIVLELETRNSPFETKEQEIAAAVAYLRDLE